MAAPDDDTRDRPPSPPEVALDATEEAPITLLDAFDGILDTRVASGVLYPLPGVLGMLTLGMIVGRGSVRAAWLWGCENWDAICGPLGFGEGVGAPSYGDVWWLLATCPLALATRAIQVWVEAVIGHAVVLAADGKSLRGSKRRKARLPALEIVAIAAPELDGVITQRTVVGGNSRDTLLTLLREVNLDGRLLTVDAGLISPALVDQVAAQGGQVLAPIKANYADVQAAITTFVAAERPTAPAAIAFTAAYTPMYRDYHKATRQAADTKRPATERAEAAARAARLRDDLRTLARELTPSLHDA
jgi:hypothetical protein